MTKHDNSPLVSTSELPQGEMKCVLHSGKRYLVAHTDAGFFVSDEMCTHEDARLCDGNLTGTLVKCPLHGSRFDLTTGQVLDDPAEDNLKIYPIKIQAGNIYLTSADSD